MGILDDVEEVSVLEFADLARRLAAASRGAGLVAPAFRSPPRVPAAVRTIRRYPGGATVSVRVRGRSRREVAVDMVEGVLVANGQVGSVRMRRALLGHLLAPGTRGAAAA